MLFRGTMTFHYDNKAKYIHTLYGTSARFFCAEMVVRIVMLVFQELSVL